jgi:hemerythrin
MYIEKQSRERLVEALERLVECTRASFRSEEALMEFLTGHADPLHCETHDRVLAQLASLRTCAMDFDRGSLLARLIMVDRELSSHISEAVQGPDRQQQKAQADCEPSLDAA